MSTPSTLPPHHPNYGYSHHQNYQSNSVYRNNNTLLNGGSRLGASYQLPIPSSNNNSASASSIAADPPRSQIAAQSSATISSSRPESKINTMPASSSSSVPKQNSKKRQRSREREPDWHKFYKNGLPKEVIVIDDSPTPDPSNSVLSNTQNARSVNGGARHVAKRRKGDDAGSMYDPIYHDGPSHSNDQSPEYKHSSGGTISTDRTTSAIHTTAATSLGSHSSNGQNGYEVADIQPGQKRKRTGTRLQAANEAKKRDLETNGDAFTNYKPPPRPPIKAPDVQVKLVADASLFLPAEIFQTDQSSRTRTQRIARSTTTMGTILWCLILT